MKILVTGSLGFIGFHLTKKLIEEGHQIVGIDNINHYYDPNLKLAKLPLLGISESAPCDYQHLNGYSNFKFIKLDIKDRKYLEQLFIEEQFDCVCHLAAQAGVQFSIKNPHTYIENNVSGFINILDACRQTKVKHFIFASSSSVYGSREKVPFNEEDNVDHPISIYAASKKSNELMAYTYNHLYHLKTTGLRFFTVYGPWGRPDMAPFIFTKNISENKEISVFNNGNMERDFTCIDDIIDGINLIINGNNHTNYKIYNIGNSSPVNLNEFINTLEDTLEKKAKIQYRPMREGDVIKTYADTTAIARDFGYQPKTSVKDGIKKFVDWYKEYYNLKIG